MQLDRLQATLRSRTAHEAIDLGFAMTRRWAGPIWRGWLVAVVPLWLLVLALTWSVPWLGLLLIWWLKPAWDRVPMHILSRSLFGATPSVRALIRALPRLYSHALLGPLTVFRLSPVRSFTAAVPQLEGLRGQRALRRRQVLLRGSDGSAAVSLLLAGLGIEASVAIGLLGMVLVMLPDAPRFALDHLALAFVEGTAPWWLVPVPALCWLVAITVVEPFYVAGGFALYLNRRTALEGWDVELSFRRIARRIARSQRQLAGLLMAAVLGAAPLAAQAQPTAPEIEETVQEVLSDELFGTTRTETSWQPREWADLDWEWPWGDSEPEPAVDLPGLGSAIEVVLWVVFGLGLLGLVLMLVRQWGARSPAARPEPRALPRLGTARPAALPGGALLPADPEAAARRLWAQGEATAALGVLFATAVDRLTHVHGLPLDPSATEGELLRTARRSGLPVSLLDPFTALTQAWQSAAYAHRAPTEASFQALFARLGPLLAPSREAA